MFVDPQTFRKTIAYGTGIDGTVVISTNTSLTRDMHYTNLTVNTGVILNPA